MLPQRHSSLFNYNLRFFSITISRVKFIFVIVQLKFDLLLKTSWFEWIALRKHCWNFILSVLTSFLTCFKKLIVLISFLLLDINFFSLANDFFCCLNFSNRYSVFSCSFFAISNGIWCGSILHKQTYYLFRIILFTNLLIGVTNQTYVVES